VPLDALTGGITRHLQSMAGPMWVDSDPYVPSRPSAREVRCRDVSGTKQVELRPRSAIWTPSQGRSGGPRLHASTTASLHPGSGVVLSRGPKCITEAAWRRLTWASDMGPPALNMGIMHAYSHEWQLTCALH
jgi:hypothetical protein